VRSAPTTRNAIIGNLIAGPVGAGLGAMMAEPTVIHSGSLSYTHHATLMFHFKDDSRQPYRYHVYGPPGGSPNSQMSYNDKSSEEICVLGGDSCINFPIKVHVQNHSRPQFGTTKDVILSWGPLSAWNDTLLSQDTNFRIKRNYINDALGIK
jgi:hypothetical protein